MSYQVIARKWRPQSFDEVSGQGHVTTALRNAIRSERIPHAMLLTGPRGVGKTTLARLIARCLNCEKGPTDTPCGSCTSCNEITEGRSVDVQEIDAASRTGVDDMREVIESIRYAAAPGKHRIYIIDEVHMLSAAAFNALLKTLEEPPPRSLFIFATTNPEKIPFTVLSRCQRHDLRRIAAASVTERLAEICKAEGISISTSALGSIAREGDGSMRDAQTLLDQIVAYAGQGGDASGGITISDETLAEVLDLVDRRVVRGIIETCIDSDPKSALEFVAQATSGGSEPRRIADALLETLRDLTVLRIAPEGRDLFEGTDEERAELVALANKTEPARLRRMFRALVREIEDLSWAPQPAAVLEMAVIRLATLPAGDDVAQLLSRLDQLERRLASGGGNSGGGRSGGSGGPPKSGSAGKGASRAEKSASAPPKGPGKRADSSATRADASDSSAADAGWGDAPVPPPSKRAVSVESAVGGDAVRSHGRPVGGSGGTPNGSARNESADEPTLGGGAPPAALFDRFRAKALEKNRSRFASLASTELVGIRGNTMTLGAEGSFHADRLRDRTAELEAFASEFFDQPTRIRVEVHHGQDAAGDGPDLRESTRQRRQNALNSEPVNLAIEVLDAEIVEIRPFGENR